MVREVELFKFIGVIIKKQVSEVQKSWKLTFETLIWLKKIKGILNGQEKFDPSDF